MVDTNQAGINIDFTFKFGKFTGVPYVHYKENLTGKDNYMENRIKCTVFSI